MTSPEGRSQYASTDHDAHGRGGPGISKSSSLDGAADLFSIGTAASVDGVDAESRGHHEAGVSARDPSDGFRCGCVGAPNCGAHGSQARPLLPAQNKTLVGVGHMYAGTNGGPDARAWMRLGPVTPDTERW